MNHQVPEMMFSTDDSPAHGISAVKAIAIASAEGQRIWTIDQNNWHLAQNALNLPADTMQDIRNAVHAGKVVTTHEEQILFHGWVGEGYIILDPQTGGGAYMIAGGKNGGFIDHALDVFTEWYFQFIDRYGGAIGSALAKAKSAVDRAAIVIRLISECSPGMAIAGILAVTLIAAGFAMTVLMVLALKVLIMSVLYMLFIGWVIGEVADAFVGRCRENG